MRGLLERFRGFRRRSVATRLKERRLRADLMDPKVDQLDQLEKRAAQSLLAISWAKGHGQIAVEYGHKPGTAEGLCPRCDLLADYKEDR
jgi:hypothetical protein